MPEFRFETERLALRSWRDDDVAAFHGICSDPKVMATLGPVMSREETAALIGRARTIDTEHGHTFWALERVEDHRLIGWCGAIRGNVGPVDGKAEIGWRLASDCWGKGYASEAARATVNWAFAHLPDDALYAITNVNNTRSRAVMERLGMAYQPELDFGHPRIDPADPLHPHVTYRLGREEWRER